MLDDFESTSQCFLIDLLCPDVVKVEVGGDYDPLWPDGSHLSELVFCRECFVLGDLLEDSEHECLVLLNVINEDCLLVCVAVPEL